MFFCEFFFKHFSIPKTIPFRPTHWPAPAPASSVQSVSRIIYSLYIAFSSSCGRYFPFSLPSLVWHFSVLDFFKFLSFLISSSLRQLQRLQQLQLQRQRRRWILRHQEIPSRRTLSHHRFSVSSSFSLMPCDLTWSTQTTCHKHFHCFKTRTHGRRLPVPPAPSPPPPPPVHGALLLHQPLLPQSQCHV